MEVSVVNAENLPDGCMLSLIAGHSRRLAPLVPRQKFAFSRTSAAAATAAGGSGMKVEVLSLQGTARISSVELLPNGSIGGGSGMSGHKIEVPVRWRGKSGTAVGDAVPSMVKLHVRPLHKDSSKAGGGSETSRLLGSGMSLASARVTSPEPAAELVDPIAEEPLSMAIAPESATSLLPAALTPAEPVSKPPLMPVDRGLTTSKPTRASPAPRNSARHHVALEARSYLEEHSILPFVEEMLRKLVKERPENPWQCISSLLPLPDKVGDVEQKHEPDKVGDAEQKHDEELKLPGPPPAVPSLSELVEESAQTPWALMPSVGTWNMRRTPRVRPACSPCSKEHQAGFDSPAPDVEAKTSNVPPMGTTSRSGTMTANKTDLSAVTSVSFVWENLDYDVVARSAPLSRTLMRQVQDEVAFRTGVPLGRIEVEIGRGSVTVAVAIQSHTTHAADGIKRLVDECVPDFLKSLETSVLAIPGIMPALTQSVQAGLGASSFQSAVRQKLCTAEDIGSQVEVASTAAPESAAATLTAFGTREAHMSGIAADTRESWATLGTQTLSNRATRRAEHVTFDASAGLVSDGEQSQTKEAEDLRERAKHVLFQATMDGALANALDKTKTLDLLRTQTEVKDSQREEETDDDSDDDDAEEGNEDMRVEVRNTLVNASASGMLAPVLKGSMDASDDMQGLKMQLKDTLLRAAQGSTRQSTSCDQGVPSGLDEESIRLQVRDKLLRASSEELSAALGQATAIAQAPTELPSGGIDIPPTETHVVKVLSPVASRADNQEQSLSTEKSSTPELEVPTETLDEVAANVRDDPPAAPRPAWPTIEGVTREDERAVAEDILSFCVPPLMLAPAESHATSPMASGAGTIVESPLATGIRTQQIPPATLEEPPEIEDLTDSQVPNDQPLSANVDESLQKKSVDKQLVLEADTPEMRDDGAKVPPLLEAPLPELDKPVHSKPTEAQMHKVIEVEKAVVEFKYEKLDYNALVQDSAMVTALQAEVRSAVAEQVGVPADQIEVNLSPGSVVVSVSIPSVGEGSVDTMMGKLEQNSEGFIQSMAASALKVPGIMKAAEAGCTDLGIGGFDVKKTKDIVRVSPAPSDSGETMHSANSLPRAELNLQRIALSSPATSIIDVSSVMSSVAPLAEREVAALAAVVVASAGMVEHTMEPHRTLSVSEEPLIQHTEILAREEEVVHIADKEVVVAEHEEAPPSERNQTEISTREAALPEEHKNSESKSLELAMCVEEQQEGFHDVDAPGQLLVDEVAPKSTESKAHSVEDDREFVTSTEQVVQSISGERGTVQLEQSIEKPTVQQAPSLPEEGVSHEFPSDTRMAAVPAVAPERPESGVTEILNLFPLAINRPASSTNDEVLSVTDAFSSVAPFVELEVSAVSALAVANAQRLDESVESEAQSAPHAVAKLHAEGQPETSTQNKPSVAVSLVSAETPMLLEEIVPTKLASATASMVSAATPGLQVVTEAICPEVLPSDISRPVSTVSAGNSSLAAIETIQKLVSQAQDDLVLVGCRELEASSRDIQTAESLTQKSDDLHATTPRHIECVQTGETSSVQPREVVMISNAREPPCSQDQEAIGTDVRTDTQVASDTCVDTHAAGVCLPEKELPSAELPVESDESVPVPAVQPKPHEHHVEIQPQETHVTEAAALFQALGIGPGGTISMADLQSCIRQGLIQIGPAMVQRQTAEHLPQREQVTVDTVLGLAPFDVAMESPSVRSVVSDVPASVTRPQVRTVHSTTDAMSSTMTARHPGLSSLIGLDAVDRGDIVAQQAGTLAVDDCEQKEVQVADVFQALDADKDGAVSVEEMHSGIQQGLVHFTPRDAKKDLPATVLKSMGEDEHGESPRVPTSDIMHDGQDAKSVQIGGDAFAGHQQNELAEARPGSAAQSSPDDFVELTFKGLSLKDVDQDAFKAEIKDNLAKGMSKDALNELQIKLRDGSIIAELSGPMVTLKEVRAQPLSLLKVFGVQAEVTKGAQPKESSTGMVSSAMSEQASVLQKGEQVEMKHIEEAEEPQMPKLVLEERSVESMRVSGEADGHQSDAVAQVFAREPAKTQVIVPMPLDASPTAASSVAISVSRVGEDAVAMDLFLNTGAPITRKSEPSGPSEVGEQGGVEVVGLELLVRPHTSETHSVASCGESHVKTEIIASSRKGSPESEPSEDGRRTKDGKDNSLIDQPLSNMRAPSQSPSSMCSDAGAPATPAVAVAAVPAVCEGAFDNSKQTFVANQEPLVPQTKQALVSEDDNVEIIQDVVIDPPKSSDVANSHTVVESAPEKPISDASQDVFDAAADQEVLAYTQEVLIAPRGSQTVSVASAKSAAKSVTDEDARPPPTMLVRSVVSLDTQSLMSDNAKPAEAPLSGDVIQATDTESDMVAGANSMLQTQLPPRPPSSVVSAGSYNVKAAIAALIPETCMQHSASDPSAAVHDVQIEESCLPSEQEHHSIPVDHFIRQKPLSVCTQSVGCLSENDVLSLVVPIGSPCSFATQTVASVGATTVVMDAAAEDVAGVMTTIVPSTEVTVSETNAIENITAQVVDAAPSCSLQADEEPKAEEPAVPPAEDKQMEEPAAPPAEGKESQEPAPPPAEEMKAAPAPSTEELPAESAPAAEAAAPAEEKAAPAAEEPKAEEPAEQSLPVPCASVREPGHVSSEADSVSVPETGMCVSARSSVPLIDLTSHISQRPLSMGTVSFASLDGTTVVMEDLAHAALVQPALSIETLTVASVGQTDGEAQRSVLPSEMPSKSPSSVRSGGSGLATEMAAALVPTVLRKEENFPVEGSIHLAQENEDPVPDSGSLDRGTNHLTNEMPMDAMSGTQQVADDPSVLPCSNRPPDEPSRPCVAAGVSDGGFESKAVELAPPKLVQAPAPSMTLSMGGGTSVPAALDRHELPMSVRSALTASVANMDGSSIVAEDISHQILLGAPPSVTTHTLGSQSQISFPATAAAIEVTPAPTTEEPAPPAPAPAEAAHAAEAGPSAAEERAAPAPSVPPAEDKQVEEPAAPPAEEMRATPAPSTEVLAAQSQAESVPAAEAAPLAAEEEEAGPAAEEPNTEKPVAPPTEEKLAKEPAAPLAEEKEAKEPAAPPAEEMKAALASTTEELVAQAPAASAPAAEAEPQAAEEKEPKAKEPAAPPAEEKITQEAQALPAEEKEVEEPAVPPAEEKKAEEPVAPPAEEMKAAVEDAINLSMTVHSVDYHALVADAPLRAAFENTMVQVIASEAGNGVMPEHVKLQLKSGSVIVDAEITPPSGVDLNAVHTNLAGPSSSLGGKVVASVNEVANIKSVATGPIELSSINVLRSSSQHKNENIADKTGFDNGPPSAPEASDAMPPAAEIVEEWDELRAATSVQPGQCVAPLDKNEPPDAVAESEEATAPSNSFPSALEALAALPDIESQATTRAHTERLREVRTPQRREGSSLLSPGSVRSARGVVVPQTKPRSNADAAEINVGDRVEVVSSLYVGQEGMEVLTGWQGTVEEINDGDAVVIFYGMDEGRYVLREDFDSLIVLKADPTLISSSADMLIDACSEAVSQNEQLRQQNQALKVELDRLLAMATPTSTPPMTDGRSFRML